MQSIRFTAVSESDLAWLFHRSPATIRKWVRAGLARRPDGSFLLADVLAWHEGQHHKEIAGRPDANKLGLQQLAELMGTSRQMIWAWSRAGLPKTSKGTYSLVSVLPWIRSYYEAAAEKRFERRLEAMQKKLSRNLAQCQRFICRAKK
ncbi:MAG: hypothetical protein A2Z25_12045 [Planctomycetes bacterium RBG_16_55_9]|nr:MAG: hypothetical protein A2Z25_12045 [Planctomycetes bacterium RBG_16_55_9]